LAIYITRVLPSSFTHELHIFSFSRVVWEGAFVEPRWGTTYQKECLMLTNHSVIFYSIDFKKRLSRKDMEERFYLSTAQDKVKKSTKSSMG
jgi:hypothetical protein